MGKLVWLMGSSGSGKDNLLAEFRRQEPAQLLVTHRHVTHAANAGDENHIALSKQEFFIRAGQNLLVLNWHANGFYCDVGVEVDLWLYVDFDAVINGSRAHLSQAQARHSTSLLPVCLQVSPAILRQRLQAHGRRGETEIIARPKHAARYAPHDCYVLNNDGSLLQSADTLLTLIGRREKKHVYL